MTLRKTLKLVFEAAVFAAFLISISALLLVTAAMDGPI